MAKTKIITAKKKVVIPKAEPVKDVVKEDIMHNIDLPDEEPDVIIPFTKQILEDTCRSIFDVTEAAYAKKKDIPNLDGYIKKEDLKDYINKEELKDYIKKEDLKDYIKKEDVEKYVQECLKNYATVENVDGIAKVLNGVIEALGRIKDVVNLFK